MNSTIIGLRVAGTVFGLVCLAQLSRLLTQSDIVIAGYHVPLWPSAIAMLVTGGLCGWLWKLSCRGHSETDTPTHGGAAPA